EPVVELCLVESQAVELPQPHVVLRCEPVEFLLDGCEPFRHELRALLDHVRGLRDTVSGVALWQRQLGYPGLREGGLEGREVRLQNGCDDQHLTGMAARGQLEALAE